MNSYPFHPILAANAGTALVVLGVLAILVVLIIVAVVFQVIGIWIRALVSGASVTLGSLIGMKLRRVNPSLIVDARIRLVKAGLSISTDLLEAHFLAGGDVINVVNALIAAD